MSNPEPTPIATQSSCSPRHARSFYRFTQGRVAYIFSRNENIISSSVQAEFKFIRAGRAMQTTIFCVYRPRHIGTAGCENTPTTHTNTHTKQTRKRLAKNKQGPFVLCKQLAGRMQQA